MGTMAYSLLWVMQDVYHQPSTLNPIDPLKEPLKVTLSDPFTGTLGLSPNSRSSGVRLLLATLGFLKQG